MSATWHHAVNSAKKFGGTTFDTLNGNVLAR